MALTTAEEDASQLVDGCLAVAEDLLFKLHLRQTEVHFGERCHDEQEQGQVGEADRRAITFVLRIL